jgi:hypothetical protein
MFIGDGFSKIIMLVDMEFQSRVFKFTKVFFLSCKVEISIITQLDEYFFQVKPFFALGNGLLQGINDMDELVMLDINLRNPDDYVVRPGYYKNLSEITKVRISFVSHDSKY